MDVQAVMDLVRVQLVITTIVLLQSLLVFHLEAMNDDVACVIYTF